MPLGAAQSAWLAGLLVFWAALLLGGFLFGASGADVKRRMPVWTRMGSSATLVLAAWSWFRFGRGSSAVGFALLVAVGMTCGMAGDLFMAKVLPASNHTLAGIGAFALGHVAYIGACLSFATALGLDAGRALFGAWAAWLLVGLLGWYLVVFRGQRATFLHWAALPYSLLLASTAGFAAGLALQEPTFVLMAVGAGLFLVSDLILAGGLFAGRRFNLMDDVVWLTYGPAQMLIVYSIGSALRFAAGG